MSPGMEVGLSPDDFVLHRDPVPSPIGGIKMPLGMDVGLIRVDFVFDGDPGPSQKGSGAPDFRPMSVAAKRLDGS